MKLLISIAIRGSLKFTVNTVKFTLECDMDILKWMPAFSLLPQAACHAKQNLKGSNSHLELKFGPERSIAS